ncbi:MAG: hypothetical protein M1834_004719 [Cirrosporium novae-zelandiae]|nr:MAG: hypothetical protein M1834_004719 [Cirrosporium novae-zelandiae]
MVYIFRRQRDDFNDDDDFDDDDDDDSWWWSSEAYTAKWITIAVVFLLCLLYFVIGYWHAQRRLKKGLPLLAYHRWLVPRRRYTPQPYYNPYYQPPPPGAGGQPGPQPEGGYYMNAYSAPPPAYNPYYPPPPKYVPPPEGGSKVDPAQGQTQVRDTIVGQGESSNGVRRERGDV